jgi:hypothetical protein
LRAVHFSNHALVVDERTAANNGFPPPPLFLLLLLLFLLPRLLLILLLFFLLLVSSSRLPKTRHLHPRSSIEFGSRVAEESSRYRPGQIGGEVSGRGFCTCARVPNASTNAPTHQCVCTNARAAHGQVVAYHSKWWSIFRMCTTQCAAERERLDRVPVVETPSYAVQEAYERAAAALNPNLRTLNPQPSTLDPKPYSRVPSNRNHGF